MNGSDATSQPPARSGAKRGAGASSAYATYQQKRRQAALERQKSARQEKQSAVRSLAAAAATEAAADGQAGQQDGAAAAAAMAVDAGAAPAGTGRRGRHQRAQQPQQQQSQQQQSQQQPQPQLMMLDAGEPPLTEQRQPLYGLDGVDAGSLSGGALRSYFAAQLMAPEWLTDVPRDLAAFWLVSPRPEGKRCLVISSGGSTVSRTRTGGLLQRFASKLPGGGPASSQHGSFCVLDCIFQEDQLPALPHQQPQQPQQQQQQQQQDIDMQQCQQRDAAAAHATGSNNAMVSGTFYIQDVLAWRGYGLVDCSTECRLFWLQSKLAEHVEEAAAPGGQQQQPWQLDGGPPVAGHDCRFALLPSWPATPEGLTAAATAGSTAPPAAAAAGSSGGGSCFTQDGLYLRHREGHYSLGGASTPLALLWKDESCSRYLLDTDAAGAVPQHQQVVLAFTGDADGGVATGDDPPVVLGRLPAEFVAAMGPKLLRPGRLLRFSVRGGGLTFSPADGSPCGADLAYEGPANQRRGRPDGLSKVLFQWQARAAPLRLPQLLAAAASQQGQAAAAGSAGSAGGGGDDDAVGLSGLGDALMALDSGSS